MTTSRRPVTAIGRPWFTRCLALAVLVGASTSETAISAPLRLEDDWSHVPSAPAEVWNANGVVHFRGAVTGGTEPLIATLPPGLPVGATVSAALCNGRIGTLTIDSVGHVFFYGPSEDLDDAQCRISLDGITYVDRPNDPIFGMAYENGWMPFPVWHARWGYFAEKGIVRLTSAARGGQADTIFRLWQLPAWLGLHRPDADVFLPGNVEWGRRGRLHVEPSGAVRIAPRSGNLAEAQTITWLDGVHFVADASGATPLSLLDGWTGAARSTALPAALMVDGVVHLRGGVSGGTGSTLAILPDEMRPLSTVHVPIELCDDVDGTLVVRSTGEIEVVSSTGFAAASCFTSLDGASFVVNTGRFVAMPPSAGTGWGGSPFGGSPLAAAAYGGIVHLRGAVANGAYRAITDLPVTMHPETDVHVPVDLCNGERGRLLVTATGHIAVESGSFPAAQCNVSLDGITFASSDAGSSFVEMTLKNGWLPSPLATSPPAAAIVDGLVHLKGAASSGASGVIFTLPEAMRPKANVHLPTALCNAAKGRILVSTTGEVVVSAEDSFSDAQCFTGLDGLKFAPSSAGFTPLPLQNGWSAASGATYTPAATLRRDVVHFQGAVRSGSGHHLSTLPPSLRPPANVVVPVDLCSASKGVLAIEAASGDVSVYPASGVDFSQAQCQTSLEGVAFTVPEPSRGILLVSGSALLLVLGGAERRRAPHRERLGASPPSPRRCHRR